MSEWQPIETAPKNGMFVRGATESNWGKGFTALRFPYQLWQRWNGTAWEADDGRVYEPQPTHWDRSRSHYSSAQ